MATIYDIDYSLFIRRLLPSFLRKPTSIAWLESIVKPVVDLYDDFVVFRADINRRLSYTSQTTIFEKLLNDNADNTLRRIYIENIILIVDAAFSYNLSETTPPVDDLFSHNLSEGDQPEDFFTEGLEEELSQFDFIVHVPATLATSEGLIRRLIEDYKLAGKRYKIEYF